jgi:hypothetical protein
MSDLFKDHGPELSDDEDRRLWQRVRAIPGEAAGEAAPRAPWWTRLLAMPAVRYGAPAFAVLLVAVVWVVERRPEPPARAHATRAASELDQKTVPAPENAPSPMAQAPPPASRVLSRIANGEESKQQAPMSKDEPARRADGGAVLEREVTLKAAPPSAPAAPAPAAKEAGKFAVAPAGPAREEMAAKTAAPAPAPAPTTAAPSSANWGAVKSQARDSGRATGQTLADERATDQLAAGAPIGAAEPGRHSLVAEVADVQALGTLTATVSAVPGDLGLSAGESIALVLSAAGGSLVTFGRAPGTPYGSAPARVQAAALAALLERALQDPAGPPRDRLEDLRDAALKIDARAGGQGRARLLGAIDGALGATPAR